MINSMLNMQQAKVYDAEGMENGGQNGRSSNSEEDDSLYQNKPDHEDLPQILKDYLLYPRDDGQPARRISSAMTYFVPLLLSTPEHRQTMCIAIGELLAILGGLLLAVTLTHEIDAHEEGDITLWGDRTTTADWMDGIAGFAEIMLTITCLVGFACGVIAASADPRKSLAFYAGLIHMLDIGMTFMFIGVLLTMILLLFDASKYAHPLSSTIFDGLAACGFLFFLSKMADQVFAHMPLVTYHMPPVMWLSMRVLSPFNPAFKTDILYAAATAEAAALRKKLKQNQN